MPLVIADQDREILSANRLRVVVAEAKFPPIYAVNTPAGIAAFQDAIRGAYPIAEERPTVMRVRIAPGTIGADGPEPGPWRFRTDDGSWIVALSQDSLIIEASAFRTFDEFHDRASVLFNGLVDVLGPARLDRIGLRFVNEFAFQDVKGLAAWRPLLDPGLLGILGEGDLVDRVTFTLQQVNLDLEGGKVIFKHGYIPNPNDPTAPTAYVIDIDTYDDVQAPFDVRAILDRMTRYNGWAWNLFRASVSDELLARLREGGEAQ